MEPKNPARRKEIYSVKPFLVAGVHPIELLLVQCEGRSGNGSPFRFFIDGGPSVVFHEKLIHIEAIVP